MMTTEKEPTGSQIAGGLLGAAIGNYQGTMVGAAAATFLMTLPISGPLALLAIPAIFGIPVAGALGGTYIGAKAGSQGIDRAALMLLGALPKEKV